MPPAASISAAAVKIVPGSFGFGSAVFAAIAIDAPSAAARNAIARPIPRDPPVINIRLPLSDIFYPLFFFIKKFINACCASSESIAILNNSPSARIT